MLAHRLAPRAAGAALLSIALASCSLVGGPWATRHKPAPPPPPPPPPPPSEIGAAPVALFKFAIDPRDDVVGRVQVTHSTQADTLVDIARRFDLGYDEIGRANPGVDMWLPGAGTKVVLPTQFVLPDAPHVGIVVNIAAMRLYYFLPRKRGEKQVVYTHPIGIGKMGWRTPVGVTRIVRREKEPTWRPPPSIIKEHREEGDDLPAVIGPGPDNPLGDRALYLGWAGYLIHGTNKPAGVGMRVSHGCMHLFPEDIDALFDKVPIGTPVRVVNQPFVFGWHDGQLYMQSFGTLKDDHRDWRKVEERHALLRKVLGARVMRELKRRHLQVNADLVAQLVHDPRGIPVPVTDPDASVAQVLATALQVKDVLPEGANWDGKTDLPADQMSPPGVKQATEAQSGTPDRVVKTDLSDPPAAPSSGRTQGGRADRTATLEPASASGAPGHASP